MALALKVTLPTRRHEPRRVEAGVPISTVDSRPNTRLAVGGLKIQAPFRSFAAPPRDGVAGGGPDHLQPPAIALLAGSATAVKDVVRGLGQRLAIAIVGPAVAIGGLVAGPALIIIKWKDPKSRLVATLGTGMAYGIVGIVGAAMTAAGRSIGNSRIPWAVPVGFAVAGAAGVGLMIGAGLKLDALDSSSKG